MRKRLNNVKLSLSSFHLCRAKKSEAVTPAYRLPSFNSKTRNVDFARLPPPPPTNGQFRNESSKRRLNFSGSSVVNLDLSAASDYSSSDSFEVGRRNDAKWQARTNYRNRINLDSCDFGLVDPDPVNKGKQNGALVLVDTCYEEEEEEEEEEEPESLRYSSRSISFDSSSYEFSHAAVDTTATGSSDSDRSTVAAGQRLKELVRRQVVSGWTSGRGNEYDTSSVSAGEMGGSSMGEAMAVVKKSSNPKEDFRRSMLEMISDKEIYDAKELEELLQCLLSLNSRQYHADIVQAFSDIWKMLFL